MSYPTLHMISWQRYGYRMIGDFDRYALARGRTMGQSLNLSSSQYHRPGTSTTTGESTTYTPPPPAPAPRPPHVIHLVLPPPPPPPVPAPVRAIVPPPPPVIPAPVRTMAQSNPVCPPCPQCAPEPSKVLWAGAGALGAGLLMYVVGLATRERKKKGRR